MHNLGGPREAHATARCEEKEEAKCLAISRDQGHDRVKPLPLVETRKVGDLTVHAIQAGGQRLDGGAMFGVVPKPLWERRIPPDEKNRIQLGMRCLIIEHSSGLVLIDSGAGNKEDQKFKDIYGIENEGVDGRTSLE